MTLTKVSPTVPRHPTVPRQPTVEQIIEHCRERGGFISRGKALVRLVLVAATDPTDPRAYAYAVADWVWHVNDNGAIAYDHPIRSRALYTMHDMFDLGPNPDPNRWQFSEVKGTYT